MVSGGTEELPVSGCKHQQGRLGNAVGHMTLGPSEVPGPCQEAAPPGKPRPLHSTANLAGGGGGLSDPTSHPAQALTL